MMRLSHATCIQPKFSSKSPEKEMEYFLLGIFFQLVLYIQANYVGIYVCMCVCFLLLSIFCLPASGDFLSIRLLSS